jgi:hypothetical protein
MRPSKNKRYCHDCGRKKQVFETEKKAEIFIKFNSNDIELENGYAPKRSYFCVACGAWHITSKENDFHGKSFAEKVLEKYTIEKEKKEINRKLQLIEGQKKQEINNKLQLVESKINNLLKKQYGNDALKYKEILNYAFNKFRLVKESDLGNQDRKNRIEHQLSEIKFAIENGSFFDPQDEEETLLSKEQRQKITQSIKLDLEVLDASKDRIDIEMLLTQLASVNSDFDSVKDCWIGGQKLKDEIENKLNMLNKYAAQ